MNSKPIPLSDQSPYVLSVLSQLLDREFVDEEVANRIRVDAQLEAQRKINEIVQQSKAYRETQIEKMCQELAAECPEKSKQDLLNQQISNFKADMALKDQTLDKERDDINKMIFESLEDNHQNFANLVIQEYLDRGLSPKKFEQIKKEPKQPVPKEFVYVAAKPDPEQSGMSNRQNNNWFKVLEPKASDGVQKVRLFVRLVDEETKVTLNARLMDKDSPNPYYLLEGIYTPPNVAPGGFSRVMAEFRDFLIQTGIEAVVAKSENNLKIAELLVNNGFKVSADGIDLAYHGLLERPHRTEMLEALKLMVQENTGIVSLGSKEHEGSVYEYFAITVVEGVQSPTSGKTLLNHEDLFRVKAGPDGIEIKHQIESQFGNEVLALKLNRKGLLADLQTSAMLCAAEEGLGLESQWTVKVDLPSGLKGGRFDRAQVNEEIKQGIEPLGIAALHPKGPNGYERFDIKTASLGSLSVTAMRTDASEIKEASKMEQTTVQASVPPPLPQKRRSALDEIENPEVKEKKESKVKKAKKDRDMEAGA